MIENECVRALNYAVFRPSLHELKCNSRTSLAINIYMWPSITKIYSDIFCIVSFLTKPRVNYQWTCSPFLIYAKPA